MGGWLRKETRSKLPDLLLWLGNLRTWPSFHLLYLVKTTIIPGSRGGDQGPLWMIVEACSTQTVPLCVSDYLPPCPREVGKNTVIGIEKES